MPNKLILDTDGGVDDAQALLLLIANGRPPDAITTVFGNVDLDTATDNVLAVLAVAGADIDVHKGAPEPLEEEIVIHAREVHGDDGLGGAPRPHTIAEIAGSDAAGFLVSELSIAATTGRPVDLLFIGPLTNLAMALAAAPGIVSGIGRLTIMGGTVYGRGNTTPAAEFNIYRRSRGGRRRVRRRHRHRGRAVGALRLALHSRAAEVEALFARGARQRLQDLLAGAGEPCAQDVAGRGKGDSCASSIPSRRPSSSTRHRHQVAPRIGRCCAGAGPARAV